MRTTISIDDHLLAEAQAMTGLAEKTAPVREALKALIERWNCSTPTGCWFIR